jgi:hypothetical protein
MDERFLSIFDNLASFSPSESLAANQMIRLDRHAPVDWLF